MPFLKRQKKATQTVRQNLTPYGNPYDDITYIVRDELAAKFKEAGDKSVAVDFFANWCPPCKMIKPKFAALSEQFTDMIFCSVDVDEVDGIAQSYGVTALPTFIFFKHGEEVKRITGADKDVLESTIKEVIGASGCGVQCQRPV